MNPQDFLKFIKNEHTCLSIISRFNFKSRLHHESVAEHSFYTTLYASIISDMIKPYCKIDSELVLKMSLIHDAEEAILGDVLATTKLAIKDTYNKLAESIVDNLLFDYAKYWKTYNDNKIVECLIIKFADKVSGVSFCMSEIELGNKLFLSTLSEYKNVISKFETYNYPNDDVAKVFYVLADLVIFDIDTILEKHKVYMKQEEVFKK